MAGGRMKYTVQEAHNTALGQLGSVFISDTNASTPNNDLAYVAVTIIEDATFTGLVPEDGVSIDFLSTTTASTAGANGNAITSSTTFSAGTTLYGRWSSITLAGGAVIAYVG